MILAGDCIEVMAGMEPESIDAIVTDPPYGLGFMGKAWDSPGTLGESEVERWQDEHTSPMRRRPETDAVNAGMSRQGGRQWRGEDGQKRQARDMRVYQAWCEDWSRAMYRVAKPSSYLLAFGGTRTVHRMTCALEDTGWIIRDMLVWAYASGFPKSKASLKPAWEPIVMARKPGPLRMLAIDECRIPAESGLQRPERRGIGVTGGWASYEQEPGMYGSPDGSGRWPANVILTDPVFDGGWEGVVGGGEAVSRGGAAFASAGYDGGWTPPNDGSIEIGYGDSGTYSRFFLVPKSSRSDREPVLGGLPNEYEHSGPRGHVLNGDGTPRPRPRPRPRENVHPTVKPVDLMRHLVRLVTPRGGTVLDPFLGSGTTGLAAEMEGFAWVGIEREAEYVAIAEARLNGTQRGLGLG